MKMFSIITIGLLLTLASPAFGSPADYMETVESYLKNTATELKATEYKDARNFIPGDLNDDGVDDLAVKFTMEGIVGGGNNYSFFLAVFLREDKGYQLASEAKVGGKSSRTLELTSVDDGVMTFSTLFHTIKPNGKWDALCCPSGIGKAYYALVEDTLVELNTSEAVPIDFRRLMKRMRE